MFGFLFWSCIKMRRKKLGPYLACSLSFLLLFWHNIINCINSVNIVSWMRFLKLKNNILYGSINIITIRIRTQICCIKQNFRNMLEVFLPEHCTVTCLLFTNLDVVCLFVSLSLLADKKCCYLGQNWPATCTVVFTNKRSQAKVYTMYFGISSI